MTSTTFGPADLYVVAFPEPRVPEPVREAALATLANGAITLLDLVVVRRRAEEPLEILEIENLGDELDLAVIEAAGSGLIGGEDLDELAAGIELGISVLAILLENTWARAIAAAVPQSDTSVVSVERFPADVINEVAGLAGVRDSV